MAGMEYDPRPPFDAGFPEGAGPATVARFTEFAGGTDRSLHRAVSRVLERRVASSS
jgi:cyclohexyl-isocyanide hydratase